MPAGFLLAFHDEYGARSVATGRIRRFVEAFEYARYLEVQTTPGYEPPPVDAAARRQQYVAEIAALLSYEPVTRRYGYYNAENRRWYMKPDAILQRLQHEGRAWLTSVGLVTGAIRLRKGGA